MIIFVDIDETICHYPDGDRIYETAQPIVKNIKKVNRLYDSGNKIVYWTARGSVTGVDYEYITKNQLTRWGAKHHDLKLGKPYYDLFICDKALNSNTFFKEDND